MGVGGGKLILKLNSAQLELELGLSLAINKLGQSCVKLRSSLVKVGQVWSSLVKFGQVWSSLVS